MIFSFGKVIELLKTWIKRSFIGIKDATGTRHDRHLAEKKCVCTPIVRAALSSFFTMIFLGGHFG